MTDKEPFACINLNGWDAPKIVVGGAEIHMDSYTVETLDETVAAINTHHEAAVAEAVNEAMEKYRAALEEALKTLEDIKEHQKMVAGVGFKWSVTWNVAQTACAKIREVLNA